MATLMPETKIMPGIVRPKTMTSKARKLTTTFVIGLPAGRVRKLPLAIPGCAAIVTNLRRHSCR